MIKIAPVGSAEAISQHTPQHLYDHGHQHAPMARRVKTLPRLSWRMRWTNC